MSRKGDESSYALPLTAPSGQQIALDDGTAHGPPETRWRVTYTSETTDLADLLGQQPSGDWVLQVDNRGGAHRLGDPAQPPLLQDFVVLTYGSFFQYTPGSRATRPAPLRLAPGATARRLRGDTLGGVDHTAPSCALPAAEQRSGPERWYELELSEQQDVQVELAAGFPAALELRAGACAQSGPSLACAHVRWDEGEGYEPRVVLERTTLAAGSWCVLVDGVPG